MKNCIKKYTNKISNVKKIQCNDVNKDFFMLKLNHHIFKFAQEISIKHLLLHDDTLGNLFG